MFILFINDIVLEFNNSEFEMYADISTICKSAKTVQEVNQLWLKTINLYMSG